MSQNAKPEAFKGERGNVYKFNLREHPDLIREIPGFNVRQDFGDLIWLKESIIENGMKVPASGYYRDGVWFVTDGHRRFRAAKMAVEEGHDVIFKIEAEPKGYTEGDRLADMLTRNSGEPLKMLEEAEIYQRLSKLGFTDEMIAEKTRKSIVHVRNVWKLLEAEPEVLEMVEKGNVAPSTVVELQKDFTPLETKAKLEKALIETGKSKVTAKDIDGARKGGERKKKPGAEEGRQTAAEGYQKVMEQAKEAKNLQSDKSVGKLIRELTTPEEPGATPPNDFPELRWSR